ncbi:hypothetical protein [Pyruvatibacter sp.]|uniref:ATP-grasp domain-containing protein n=1 Tax=Pyruvatibacter sp. TaxID=1981328 RepID=UPI0032645BC1
MSGSLAIAGREFPWFDDRLLADELTSRSVEVDFVDWRSPDFEPADYDAVYVSSTWNLRQDPDGFLDWLARCEADGRQRLINDAPVLREGVIKSIYLTAMAERFGEDDKPEGSITPSRFYSLMGEAEHNTRPAAGTSLSDITAGLDESPEWQGRDLVLKPIVSADGHDTYIVVRSGALPAVRPEHVLDLTGADEAFEGIVQAPGGYGAIVQCYQRGIEAGEYSLVFLGGAFSHGILKPPGFRSSDTSQRRALDPAEIPPAMLGFAQAIIDWAATRYGEGAVTRARIDLIKGEHGPVLCEFECVEPNTNLRSFDEAARASIVPGYADAILARMAQLRHHSGG